MIIGNNIDLRIVEVKDAEFILSLRINPELNKHLSFVENDLKKQQDWIISNDSNKTQWYFIIQNKAGTPVGTVRIYDVKESSFCWGSWIVLPEARSYASFESAVLSFEFAFDQPNFNKCLFDVRKANQTALNFYIRFGAKIISDDEENFYLEYTKSDFIVNSNSYKNYLKTIAKPELS